MVKYEYKKKKVSTKKKLIIVFIIILLIIISILLYLHYVVNPIIIDASEAKVRSLTQSAVESAVYDVIKDEYLYSDLIEIIKDSNNDIQMISANAYKINLLSKEILNSAQNNLTTLGEQGIEIGIGTFTGITLFTDKGPKVSIKLSPIGTIYTRFHSEFTSAGINQTNHSIYLYVQTDVSLILPTDTKVISTTTEVLLTESIIQGKIPDTYLNSNQLDEMLNLVPKN